MDSKFFARIGAVAFVAVAITMTVLQMRETPQPAPTPTITAATEPAPDPLRAELIRCQAMGEASASDAACLRTWAENRRRFLAPGTPPKGWLPASGQARE